MIIVVQNTPIVLTLLFILNTTDLYVVERHSLLFTILIGLKSFFI